jgi:HPt (histidine-containing phosphotransfer) domain-containing protein
MRIARRDFALRRRPVLLPFPGMSSAPPPNSSLQELASVLGDDNVRTLVRTFLREFPVALQNLTKGARRDRHRVAHSMKSNSRLVGALALSDRMAAIELRLEEENGADVDAREAAAIAAEFESIAGPLRKFVEP